MDYRKEIDGLRAVSVLSVILFHAGLDVFSGGFLGVDVFFVISGYLMAKIILEGLAQGSFSLAGFYERRARRIFPALFLVMLVCVPCAWLWLTPGEMLDFSQSLWAMSLFSSNILFWLERGYFDGVAELKPLLHTWSLSVEEQFYLVFPLAVLICWRFARSRLPVLLILAAAASLALAHWGAVARPTATFFLLPTRVWELLSGAIAASVQPAAAPWRQHRAVREGAAALGLGMILVPVLLFDRFMPLPGLPTAIPVGGTLLILLFAGPETAVGRLLSGRLLVGIGLISYSLYLWHQPVFAFARLQGVETGHWAGAALIAPVAGLAYLSWKYVETPFRVQGVFSRRQVFAGSVAGLALFFGLGLSGIVSEGFKTRLPPNIRHESLGAQIHDRGHVCTPGPVQGYEGVLACTFGDVTATQSLALYGDSHAMALGDELSAALRRAGVRGVRLMLDGCEVVPEIRDVFRYKDVGKSCDREFAALLRYLHDHPSDLVAASRWTLRLYPIAGEITDMPSRTSDGAVETDEDYTEYAVLDRDGSLKTDAASKAAALRRLIGGFLATGRTLHLVYPVPETALNIAKLNYRHYARTGTMLEELSYPQADYIRRNRFVTEIFDSFTGHPNFSPVRPQEIFCNTFIPDRCAAQYRGVPFYLDDDHLSDAGARLIVERIMGRQR